MKVQNLFKKTDDDQATELNDALDKVIKTEDLRDETQQNLENARQHLENEQQRDIDGDEGVDTATAVRCIVTEMAKFESLDSLLKKTKANAISILARGSVSHRKRLAECGTEIASIRRAVDERRIASIAEFAKKHKLQVFWPDKNNSGTVVIPAVVIEGDELQKVADGVVVAVHRDKDAGKLESLYAEKQRLSVVTRSTPDLALDSLLAERRRK